MQCGEIASCERRAGRKGSAGTSILTVTFSMVGGCFHINGSIYHGAHSAQKMRVAYFDNMYVCAMLICCVEQRDGEVRVTGTFKP